MPSPSSSYLSISRRILAMSSLRLSSCSKACCSSKASIMPSRGKRSSRSKTSRQSTTPRFSLTYDRTAERSPPSREPTTSTVRETPSFLMSVVNSVKLRLPSCGAGRGAGRQVRAREAGRQAGEGRVGGWAGRGRGA